MAVENKQQLVGLVSGSASTLGEIYQATQDGRLPRTELAMVISSRPEAGSQTRFHKLGFDISRFVVIRPDGYVDRNQFADTIQGEIGRITGGPDIIGQYGWTPLTPESVIVDFTENGVSMINQHPGPVDPSPWDFGGEGMSSADRTHAARLMFVRETRREFWTDVTAQRVHTVFDGGRVLRRARVEIIPTDTVDSLKERAIVTERTLQVDVLHDFEEGTAKDQPTYNEMGIELVRPGERMLLEVVKRLARRLYPPE